MKRLPRDLYHFPDVVIPFRLVVAPFVRDAKLFIRDSGFYPGECKIVTRPEHLRGLDFRDQPGRPNNGWEVWFLGGRWPLHSSTSIAEANDMYTHLRYIRGADIRHWYI